MGSIFVKVDEPGSMRKMAGNLLHYQRYVDLVRFMCFNNLCNTSGQSCIEVSKRRLS